MKKLLPLLLVFMVGFAGTVKAPQGETTKPVTVTGTLIDSKCYGMDHDNLGDEHAVMMEGKAMKMPACGTACAKMGIPVAVLEGGKKDGKVYLIVGPAAGFADFMAKEVQFEGELAYEGAIIPTKFAVKENGKWVEKPLPGTMM